MPEHAISSLPEADRSGPVRLRDLIAHRHFALDPDIIWEVANRHVPALLNHALALRAHTVDQDTDPSADLSA